MSNSDIPPSYNDYMGNSPKESFVEFQSAVDQTTNNIQMCNPTLFPYKNFDVNLDTEAVIKAIDSSSENDLAIFLSQRTASQRKEIADLYSSKRNETLVQAIKNKFGGCMSYPLLLVGLSVPYYEYLARSIHQRKQYRWIYFILFTITPKEMAQFSNFFNEKYDWQPNDFLKRSMSSKHRTVYLQLKKVFENCPSRDETNKNDTNEVNDDVNKINQLKGGSIFGPSETEETILIEIFLIKSLSHIKKVCEHYESSTGEPIQNILKKFYIAHNLYLDIAEYAINPPKYFAGVLKSSGFLLGLYDQYLVTHIILKRSEIDLHDIKMEYKALTGKSLSTKIKGCSASYKDALLQLLGEPKD